MKTYFKQIEQKRQQLGMTIGELCKRAEIAEMTFYDAKACRTSISANKFILLCKIVGIKKLNLD